MAPDPLTMLTNRFPTLEIWYGPRTGVWWAVVPPPAGWRLVEALDPDELSRAILRAQSWPWPSPSGGANWRRRVSAGSAGAVVTSRQVDRYSACAVKRKSGQAVMVADEFPLPKYARVVTELRRRIETGEYSPGDLLPSEAQLVREFGIGRTTIVRALQMLQTDGWITREHGLGSYVKARPAGEKNSTRLGRAVLELPETTPGFSLLHAGPADAPPQVATLLGAPGDAAVLRRWVSMYDGRPSELVSCWFPASIADGTDLGKADPLVSGIRQHLQAIKHARVDHIVERLSARLPDPREAELLQIAAGSPVLEVTATVHDASDVLLLIVAIALPGELHELEDSYAVTD